jgi:hypothetical protein
MRPIALSLLFCSLATALPASAQIYRWVDDEGVVNYANTPPAPANRAIRIDPQAPRVGVIPAAPRVARVGVAPPPSAPADFPSRIDRATVANLQGTLERHERPLVQADLRPLSQGVERRRGYFSRPVF